MYNRIPTVLTAEELLDKAMGRASRVEVTERNRMKYERMLSITKLDTVNNTMKSTISKYLNTFPVSEDISPFYRELLDAMLDGIDKMDNALRNIRWGRDMVERIARDAIRSIKRTEDVREILRLRRAAYGRISSIINRLDGDLNFLNRARNTMRSLPDIDPEMPTVVVAGAPNVGKSLLVSQLSRAKPEVASYPFTTKEISVGHMEFPSGRQKIVVQIIDTPGLLDRPMGERNIIERRAITALKHLKGLILFIIDPTETCGYSMEYQQSLLSEIKASFDSEVITVANKSDMLEERPENVDSIISSITGEGIGELRAVIAEKMTGTNENTV